MPDYKENPQLALQALKDITDKFAGGVSASQIGQTAPLLEYDQNKIHEYIHNHVVSIVKQKLDDFWQDNEVDKKLGKMKELENNSLPGPVRRPETGVVDSSAIEAACLLQLKTRLQNKIDDKKKESKVLQNEISDFKVLMDRQMKEISNTRFE